MNLLRVRTFVLLLALLHAPAVWAYVDPGSGMLVIQGFITAVVALVAFVKNPWQTMKAWLARWRKKDDA